jgi:alpha-glucosidase (family GH31 glycosyl hydrolase)
MVTKLSLIRYYHSELLRLNAEGGTFYKPLFFEFPDDAGAYEAPMLNVMLGRSLKLGVPSTETTIGNTDFYYPKGLWCDVFGKAKCRTQATSGNVTITGTSLGDFYLELREGHLIPFQDAATLHTALKVNNTEDLKDQAVDFLVLPICDSTSCHASGQYLNDDDTQVDLDGNLNNYTISYERLASEPDTLTLTVTQNKLATKHKDNIINKAD